MRLRQWLTLCVRVCSGNGDCDGGFGSFPDLGIAAYNLSWYFDFVSARLRAHICVLLLLLTFVAE